MELSRLIESLGKPATYPVAVAEIEIRKVKKPVDFGFLDFGTLAKRRHF